MSYLQVVDIADAQVGDIGFAMGTHLVARAIQLGEFFRRDWNGASERPGDKYNHVFSLSGLNGDPTDEKSWTVIQAEAHGVTDDKTLTTIGKYVIVRLPPWGDRTKFVKAQEDKVGSPYGFLTDGFIALTLLTPHLICVRRPGTWICSAEVNDSLRTAGSELIWSDIYTVTPAQLWIALEKGPGEWKNL